MEKLILVLVALGVIETTYLVYRSRPRNTIDHHSLLLDTSVLIDGRILPIARSGLLTAPLVIPRSVVRELQYMADKADHDKRERARAGLDMIEQLQQIEYLTIRMIDDPALSDGGVDERLVELAKSSGARLCTIDYNLNKAARVQGVMVVNINELAHALRVVHLPGEVVDLKLVQTGQEARQAVGYLDDGTMMVVDDAKAQLGHTIQVEVTRVLQTTAGKMMFARKVGKQLSERTSVEHRGRGKMFADKRTSKKLSSQTTSNVSMSADSEAKDGSLQTASSASMIAESEPTGSSPQAVSGARVTSRTSPSPKRQNKQFTRNKPANTPAQTVAEVNVIAEPTQRPNPRARRPLPSRRKTPEDSLIDQLNKQQ